LLLEYFWWGSAFLVSLPDMVMLLVLGPLLLSEHRDPFREPIDVPSAVLSIATMLTLVYRRQASRRWGAS
jgi:DHA2 family multidrug resistance protein-like MFS transporter